MCSLQPPSDWDLEQREKQDGLLRSADAKAGQVVTQPKDTDQPLDIESSGSVDVDDLQLVYFNEEDRKDTTPPLNPNVISSGGLSMSTLISNMAHSASSSALFGSGASSKNNTSSSNAFDETTGLLSAENDNDGKSNPPSSGLSVNTGASSSAISTINKELADSPVPSPRPSFHKTHTDPRSPTRRPKTQIQRLMSDSMAAVSNSALNKMCGVPGKPTLSRSMSLCGAMEASRSALAAMISQIQDLDPYPCIFGIPVMPALFRYSKFYLFLFFTIVGCRSMLVVFRDIL